MKEAGGQMQAAPQFHALSLKGAGLFLWEHKFSRRSAAHHKEMRCQPQDKSHQVFV
jgi:hypothetical protein